MRFSDFLGVRAAAGDAAPSGTESLVRAWAGSAVFRPWRRSWYAPAAKTAPERAGVLVAMALVTASAILPWVEQARLDEADKAKPAPMMSAGNAPRSSPDAPPGRETLLAVYGGAPWYYRSGVRIQRPDGTDLRLKNVGWDGDALYFPIDGGARSVSWHGRFGHMVDFLHNKAISRLGKGAHGRKIKDGVIETVEAEGTWKGEPAPKQIKLTDILERMEFTHGHNMLFATGLMKLASWTPRVQPYVGLGAGVAVPHVEVWFQGEGEEPRTNEYQYAGPAAQFIAGLELRTGKMSYFVEYKASLAWLNGCLTGGKSSDTSRVLRSNLPRWLVEPFIGLSEFPGDMYRQMRAWWRGEAPRYGRFGTTLAAHQVVVGAGYWWQRSAATAVPPPTP